MQVSAVPAVMCMAAIRQAVLIIMRNTHCSGVASLNLPAALQPQPCELRFMLSQGLLSLPVYPCVGLAAALALSSMCCVPSQSQSSPEACTECVVHVVLVSHPFGPGLATAVDIHKP